MEEGLRLDNLTKNPLTVTSHIQIPPAGSLILRQSEYLSITDAIVELSDFGKLSYVFVPIERRVLPQKAAMRDEVKKVTPTLPPMANHPASPLIKRKKSNAP